MPAMWVDLLVAVVIMVNVLAVGSLAKCLKAGLRSSAIFGHLGYKNSTRTMESFLRFIDNLKVKTFAKF